MIDRLTAFVDRLRLLGVSVSTSEVIDAARILGLIGWDDRETFRSALSAALIKNSAHRPLFDVLFDVYFSQSPHDMQLPEEATDDLASAILEGLLLSDDHVLEDLAFESVQRYAGMEPGRPVGGRYYQWKVEQALGMTDITDRLAERLASTAETGSILDDRLRHDEAQERVTGFRARIERIIRSRLVLERGPEAMARALARPLPEEVEFLQATADELAEMKRSVAVLARRLAARLSYKHHRKRKGRLDFRRTIRASLQTGGAPAYPKFKQRILRPDIVVLCDVSGSVAAFSRFALALLHALAQHFRRVRSFAFVDAIDEVSSFFQGGDFEEAARRVRHEARTVWLDGHSDYGHALKQFLADHEDVLGPKTTVLLLGDVRSNFRGPETGSLEQIRARCKRLYLLNPEPMRHWNTGDSIVSTYEPFCDGVFECRNLKQLTTFIERIG